MLPQEKQRFQTDTLSGIFLGLARYDSVDIRGLVSWDENSTTVNFTHLPTMLFYSMLNAWYRATAGNEASHSQMYPELQKRCGVFLQSHSLMPWPWALCAHQWQCRLWGSHTLYIRLPCDPLAEAPALLQLLRACISMYFAKLVAWRTMMVNSER